MLKNNRFDLFLWQRWSGWNAKSIQTMQRYRNIFVTVMFFITIFLFFCILFAQINVFMTHMSNYGNDRLALYTFESVVKFLRCWTSVRLSSAPPLRLAYKYFQLRPDELSPLWGVRIFLSLYSCFFSDFLIKNYRILLCVVVNDFRSFYLTRHITLIKSLSGTEDLFIDVVFLILQLYVRRTTP